MSTCYKCGRETPNGVPECEDGCQPVNGHQATGIAIPVPPHVVQAFQSMQEEARQRAEYYKTFRPLDWSKIKSFEELRHVMSLIFSGAGCGPGGSNYEELKPFLKDESPQNPS